MVDKFILVEGQYGIYAPQMFTQLMNPVKWGIEPHDPDWVCVEEGPSNSFYWESWEAICDKAVLFDEETGKSFYIHNEDGEIYGIRYVTTEDARDIESETSVYFY